MEKREFGKISVFRLVAIIFCGICLAVLLPAYLKVAKIKKEISKIERNIERLHSENRSLGTEIERLEKDPFVVEKLAREKLGLGKKGEIRFKFIPQDTKTLDGK